MKNLTRKILPLLFAAMLMLASCQPAEQTPSAEQNALLTAAVGTMVNSFFATQTALYTPASPTATNTFLPTLTPTPFFTPTSFATLTPTYIYYTPTTGPSATSTPMIVNGTPVTATPDPASLGAGCNNSAFLGDENYPPGTVVFPGEEFYKGWLVLNNGTCPWMFQYTITFMGGAPELNSGNLKLQTRVDPNEQYTVSVDVTAPSKSGTYSASWRLADANGVPFGATLTLSIEVQ